jgi:hypothetical protein
VVWTPVTGRAIRAVIQAATRTGAVVRIWADLDLDGVRIARLVGGWLGGAVQPFRMSPEDVSTAPARRPLRARSLVAIRADLAARPAAPLADTLRALLASESWVEQETFLGTRSGGVSSVLRAIASR